MEENREVIENSTDDFNKVIRFINKEKGVDLCSYRQSFILRHLRSRMSDTQSADCASYITYLKNNPDEIDRFLEDLSINVTHFFRDPDVFLAFRNGPLVELIDYKRKNSLNLIRIWSAGCASGQEPYSLAIMMNEVLGKKSGFMVKIWATDVDSETLERAEKGEYEERDLKEAGKKLLEKYFQPVYNDKYSVNDEIRKMVRFQKHNLISEPELKCMDVIFCRNVMIYFTRAQQEALFKKFHQSLNSLGYLVISKVESVWNRDLFECINLYNKLYQKIG